MNRTYLLLGVLALSACATPKSEVKRVDPPKPVNKVAPPGETAAKPKGTTGQPGRQPAGPQKPADPNTKPAVQLTTVRLGNQLVKGIVIDVTARDKGISIPHELSQYDLTQADAIIIIWQNKKTALQLNSWPVAATTEILFADGETDVTLVAVALLNRQDALKEQIKKLKTFYMYVWLYGVRQSGQAIERSAVMTDKLLVDGKLVAEDWHVFRLPKKYVLAADAGGKVVDLKAAKGDQSKVMGDKPIGLPMLNFFAVYGDKVHGWLASIVEGWLRRGADGRYPAASVGASNTPGRLNLSPYPDYFEPQKRGLLLTTQRVRLVMAERARRKAEKKGGHAPPVRPGGKVQRIGPPKKVK